MRRRRAAAFVIAAAALPLVLLCAPTHPASPCAVAGFDNGQIRGDGVFHAYAVTCGTPAKDCEVGDGTRAIAAEHVDAGIEMDCHAFNQFVGSGLNAIPGYVTGECFGYARTRVGAREQLAFPEHRCPAP